APGRGLVRGRARAPATPTLASFEPSEGPPGTRVVLRGSGFGADARVLFGERPLPVRDRDGTSGLTVRVPTDARAGAAFVVRTRGGEVRSGSYFALRLPPAITGVPPTVGPPRTPALPPPAP